MFRHSIYGLLPRILQDAVVSWIGRRRWKYETSTTFRELVQDLTEKQRISANAISGYRDRQLAKVLKAASGTPFYHGILPSDRDIENQPTDVLASIPALDRDTVRRDMKAFINPKYGGSLHQHGTSGTTGTPLQVLWTDECIDMERALIWRHRQETGLRFGETWRGMLGGHRIVPIETRGKVYWRVNRPARQIYFSTYHISPDTANEYLEGLRRYSVTHLEGYPSVLYALALAFRERGLKHRLNGLYYGAEPMQDFQRKLIEEVFEGYVWDFYGLTERVASASEFECRNGLHENWENCILEIVNGDGLSIPAGDYGELAGTSLSNLGFPLLRYRTGDMTRFLPGACSCGRNSRRIAPVDTKREDLLILPDGTYLSASNLTYPFKEVDNILLSQICQHAKDSIEIRIVPAETYSESDGQKLLKGLRELVPDEVKVCIRKVEDIPRTPSGKYAFCVSLVNSHQH